MPNLTDILNFVLRSALAVSLSPITDPISQEDRTWDQKQECIPLLKRKPFYENLERWNDCGTLDPGPWTLDPGLWTLDPGPWTLDSGPWTLDPGPWRRNPKLENSDSSGVCRSPINYKVCSQLGAAVFKRTDLNLCSNRCYLDLSIC
jgi:hypothetical protein